MLLSTPHRCYLSSGQQPDLSLVCRDGSVSGHTALLASCSPLLSQLLSSPGSRHCGGCSSTRQILTPGLGVAEVRAVMELLYTGKTLYCRHSVTMIMEVIRMLGLELDQVDIVKDSEKVVSSVVRSVISSDDCVDGVHHRLNRNHPRNSQENLVLTNQNTAPRQSTNHSSALLRILVHRRLERLSQDNVAEPLNKLPSKTEDISDTVLSDESLRKSRKPSYPSNSSSTSGQVMVPNSVLSEVMDMIPVETIKHEIIESADDNEEYPVMEGREEDENRADGENVTSYLSMNNSRNYVCQDCDTGFTFIRSYNWHLQRCKKSKQVSQAPVIIAPPTVLSSSQALVVCKICQESVTGLKRHLSLVHFKEKLLEEFSSSPRKCNICKKNFKSVHSLILHIGIHHGMIKKFSSNSALGSLFRKKITGPNTSSKPGSSKDVKKPEVNKVKIKNSLFKSSQMKKKAGGSNTTVDSVPRNSLYKASLLKKLNNATVPAKPDNVEDEINVSPPKQNPPQSPVKNSSPPKSQTYHEIEKPKTQEKQITKSSTSNKKKTEDLLPRKVPCGDCVKCRLPDCGHCLHCEGGAQSVIKVCVKKICRNKVWSNNISNS